MEKIDGIGINVAVEMLSTSIRIRMCRRPGEPYHGQTRDA